MTSILLHFQNDRKTRKKLQISESDLAQFQPPLRFSNEWRIVVLVLGTQFGCCYVECRLRETQHTTSSKVRRRVVRFRSTEQKPTVQNHIKFEILARREPKHTETSVLQYKDFINLRFPICRATRLFGRYNIFRQTPSNSH